MSGWTVTGLVLKKDAGGKVVPAAAVAVRTKRQTYRDDPEKTVNEAETATDADGHFEMRGVPPEVEVRFEIDDGTRAVETLSLHLPELEGTGREDLGVWLLRPGETMAIRVLGSEGSPVEGATVRAVPSGEWTAERFLLYGRISSRYRLGERGRKALDAGNGEYRLERLAPGPYRITATSPGSAMAFMNVEFPQAEPVRLLLERGRSISGVVVTTEGSPVEGATIVAAPDTGEFRARSDALGRFTLSGALWDGEIEVSASADGFIDDYKPWVPAGATDLRLVLSPTGPFVGRVVADNDGSPIPGATVSLYGRSWPPPETRTDAQGYFQVKSLPLSLRSITVNHDAFVEKDLDLSVVRRVEDSEDRVIRLKVGSALSGSVVDAATGAPISDANVIASRPEQEEARKGWRRKFTRTGADGRFKVLALDGATWTIEVRRRGYLRANRRVYADGVEPIPDMTFLLARGGALSGRVLDLAGRPLAAGRVMPALEAAGGADSPGVLEEQTVFTDSEARFRIEGLPAGVGLCLVATHRDFNRGWLAGIQVGDQEDRDGLEVRLSAGGTIEGKVVDGGGRAVPGAQFFLEGVRNWPDFYNNGRKARAYSRIYANVDDAGKYCLRHLRSGTYRLRVGAPGLASGVREAILVEEGRRTEGVDLALKEGKTITGRVVDPTDAPVAGARVSAGDAAVHPWDSQSTKADADGHFRLIGLPAAKLELSVRRQGSWRNLAVVAPSDGIVVRLESRDP